MTFGGYCEFCEKEVEAEYAAHPVTGWEAVRGRGGANRIIDRQRDTSRIAHTFCAERRADQKRRGISPDQGTLG